MEERQRHLPVLQSGSRDALSQAVGLRKVGQCPDQGGSDPRPAGLGASRRATDANQNHGNHRQGPRA
eukprot:11148291-Heterocapsa_arctica.AAC.1